MNNGLHLNGTFYSKQDLLLYCHEKSTASSCADWERNVARFVLEWFNEKDFIEVQTSGSTGNTQILRIKKNFVEQSARMTLDFLGLTPENSALLCLPANFIAGKMMIVRSILGNLHLTSIEPRGDLSANISHKVDFAAMIPMQVQNILEHNNGIASIEKISKLIIGGAPISSALEEKIRKLGNTVYSTYGMTETVSHIAMRRLDKSANSLYYKLLPNIAIEKDENNCLIIDAPHLSESIVKTKDVVNIFPNSEFEILGRLDNMIISGGIKFFPEQIEQKLLGSFSERFIISAISDSKLGEKIILIIETEQPEKYSMAYVNNLLNSKLTIFESPKEVFFLPRFPETGTSKLVRKQITEQALHRNW